MKKEIYTQIKQEIRVCDLCKKEKGTHWTDGMQHFQKKRGIWKEPLVIDIHESCLYKVLTTAINQGAI